MALRKIIDAEGDCFIQTPIGHIKNGTQKVTFTAYVKVISINGDKKQISANVEFVGDVARFTKQYQVPVSVDKNSSNFIDQVYKYLKTLPEFAGAEDC